MKRSKGVMALSGYAGSFLLMLGLPFWIISAGCLFLGWAIASKSLVPDAELGLALVIVTVFITGSTFTYNDYEDRNIDRGNVRKKGSVLVKGLISARSVLYLTIVLIVLGIMFSFFINLEFTILMLVAIVLSLGYSNPRIRFKDGGGFDLAVNMFGIGVIIPLAGWSIVRHPNEFPLFYFPCIIFGIGALYTLSTAADYKVDKKANINSIAVRLGIKGSVNLSFVLVILTAISNIGIGLFDYLATRAEMIYLWIPFLLQIIIFYRFLYVGKPNYRNLVYTILALSITYVAAVGVFLLFYVGFLPQPPAPW